MKNFIYSVLSQAGALSAKRFFGGAGFCLVMGIILYIAIETKKEPDILEEFMWMCGGLLGLDSIMRGISGGKSTPT